MSKDQGTGILERTLYGVLVYLVAKYGPRLGLTVDDVPWLAGGIVVAIGGVIGWVHNRPVSLLDRAAASVPKSSQLVIQPGPDATMADVAKVRDLARKASDKVVAGV